MSERFDDTDARVTEFLQCLSDGTAGQADGSSTETLLPLVYNQLRTLANRQMARERPGHTLQPTALVHEAFLRISNGKEVEWSTQSHFLNTAAEAMRRILINQARSRHAVKRGGNAKRESLVQEPESEDLPSERLLDIEEALQVLERAKPDARKLVNLKYFTGMSNAETAQALGISSSKVERDWRFIRSFLADALA